MEQHHRAALAGLVQIGAVVMGLDGAGDNLNGGGSLGVHVSVPFST
jgi:hypothetical protein